MRSFRQDDFGDSSPITACFTTSAPVEECPRDLGGATPHYRLGSSGLSAAYRWHILCLLPFEAGTSPPLRLWPSEV